jgi:putative Holliday junction resolvase
VLQSAGKNSKQRRDRVDSVAAVLILQTALDLEKSSGNPAGTILDRED